MIDRAAGADPVRLAQDADDGVGGKAPGEVVQRFAERTDRDAHNAQDRDRPRQRHDRDGNRGTAGEPQL